jgi:hypothetical protein
MLTVVFDLAYRTYLPSLVFTRSSWRATVGRKRRVRETTYWDHQVGCRSHRCPRNSAMSPAGSGTPSLTAMLART